MLRFICLDTCGTECESNLIDFVSPVSGHTYKQIYIAPKLWQRIRGAVIIIVVILRIDIVEEASTHRSAKPTPAMYCAL